MPNSKIFFFDRVWARRTREDGDFEYLTTWRGYKDANWNHQKHFECNTKLKEFDAIVDKKVPIPKWLHDYHVHLSVGEDEMCPPGLKERMKKGRRIGQVENEEEEENRGRRETRRRDAPAPLHSGTRRNLRSSGITTGLGVAGPSRGLVPPVRVARSSSRVRGTSQSGDETADGAEQCERGGDSQPGTGSPAREEARGGREADSVRDGEKSEGEEERPEGPARDGSVDPSRDGGNPTTEEGERTGKEVEPARDERGRGFTRRGGSTGGRGGSARGKSLPGRGCGSGPSRSNSGGSAVPSHQSGIISSTLTSCPSRGGGTLRRGGSLSGGKGAIRGKSVLSQPKFSTRNATPSWTMPLGPGMGSSASLRPTTRHKAFSDKIQREDDEIDPAKFDFPLFLNSSDGKSIAVSSDCGADEPEVKKLSLPPPPELFSSAFLDPTGQSGRGDSSTKAGSKIDFLSARLLTAREIDANPDAVVDYLGRANGNFQMDSLPTVQGSFPLALAMLAHSSRSSSALSGEADCSDHDELSQGDSSSIPAGKHEENDPSLESQPGKVQSSSKEESASANPALSRPTERPPLSDFKQDLALKKEVPAEIAEKRAKVTRNAATSSHVIIPNPPGKNTTTSTREATHPLSNDRLNRTVDQGQSSSSRDRPKGDSVPFSPTGGNDESSSRKIAEKPCTVPRDAAASSDAPIPTLFEKKTESPFRELSLPPGVSSVLTEGEKSLANGPAGHLGHKGLACARHVKAATKETAVSTSSSAKDGNGSEKSLPVEGAKGDDAQTNGEAPMKAPTSSHLVIPASTETRNEGKHYDGGITPASSIPNGKSCGSGSSFSLGQEVARGSHAKWRKAVTSSSLTIGGDGKEDKRHPREPAAKRPRKEEDERRIVSPSVADNETNMGIGEGSKKGEKSGDEPTAAASSTRVITVFGTATSPLQDDQGTSVYDFDNFVSFDELLPLANPDESEGEPSTSFLPAGCAGDAHIQDTASFHVIPGSPEKKTETTIGDGALDSFAFTEQSTSGHSLSRGHKKPVTTRVRHADGRYKKITSVLPTAKDENGSEESDTIGSAMGASNGRVQTGAAAPINLPTTGGGENNDLPVTPSRAGCPASSASLVGKKSEGNEHFPSLDHTYSCPSEERQDQREQRDFSHREFGGDDNETGFEGFEELGIKAQVPSSHSTLNAHSFLNGSSMPPEDSHGTERAKRPHGDSEFVPSSSVIRHSTRGVITEGMMSPIAGTSKSMVRKRVSLEKNRMDDEEDTVDAHARFSSSIGGGRPGPSRCPVDLEEGRARSHGHGGVEERNEHEPSGVERRAREMHPRSLSSVDDAAASSSRSSLTPLPEPNYPKPRDFDANGVLKPLNGSSAVSFDWTADLLEKKASAAPIECFYRRPIGPFLNLFEGQEGKLLRIPDTGAHLMRASTVGFVRAVHGPWVQVEAVDKGKGYEEWFLWNDPCLQHFDYFDTSPIPLWHEPSNRVTTMNYKTKVANEFVQRGTVPKHVFKSQLSYDNAPRLPIQFKPRQRLETYDGRYGQGHFYPCTVVSVDHKHEKLSVHIDGTPEDQVKTVGFRDFRLQPCGFGDAIGWKCGIPRLESIRKTITRKVKLPWQGPIQAAASSSAKKQEVKQSTGKKREKASRAGRPSTRPHPTSSSLGLLAEPPTSSTHAVQSFLEHRPSRFAGPQQYQLELEGTESVLALRKRGNIGGNDASEPKSKRVNGREEMDVAFHVPMDGDFDGPSTSGARFASRSDQLANARDLQRSRAADLIDNRPSTSGFSSSGSSRHAGVGSDHPSLAVYQANPSTTSSDVELAEEVLRMCKQYKQVEEKFLEVQDKLGILPEAYRAVLTGIMTAPALPLQHEPEGRSNGNTMLDTLERYNIMFKNASIKLIKMKEAVYKWESPYFDQFLPIVR